MMKDLENLLKYLKKKKEKVECYKKPQKSFTFEKHASKR